MNIGFDAKRFFFNSTGLGNYSRSLLASLYNFYPNENYSLFTPPLKPDNPFLDQAGNFQIVEPGRSFDRWLPSLWRRRGIVSDILKNKIEVYHGLSHEIPPALSGTGVRTVVTVHDLIFLRYPEYYKPWDVFSYKKRYLESCKKADSIIAISENTRKDLIELLKIDEKKISVVYQSVNPVFYKPVPVDHSNQVAKNHSIPDRYILSVGSLNKRKNIETLVDGLALLKDQDLKLVIVGRGSEYGNISRKVVKLGLESRVLFYPSVRNEDLPVFYSRAEVFVYPSFYEGLGLPIVESLLCGTPVVTNRGSCFSEAGGDGALYVDARSAEEVSGAIGKLGDRMLRRQMAVRGMDHARRFTAENFARGNHRVYESLV